MTERAQNPDFRRKPQIFADSPFLLEIPAFGEGAGFSQKTADFRRKPKIAAENRRKPQGSVTLGPSPLARPHFQSRLKTSISLENLQRKRDDNKNNICVFSGGGGGQGGERKIVQNAIFRGKRHDNKIFESENFIVEKFCCHGAGS